MIEWARGIKREARAGLVFPIPSYLDRLYGEFRSPRSGKSGKLLRYQP
jgi:hypothetical protein